MATARGIPKGVADARSGGHAGVGQEEGHDPGMATARGIPKGVADARSGGHAGVGQEEGHDLGMAFPRGKVNRDVVVRGRVHAGVGEEAGHLVGAAGLGGFNEDPGLGGGKRAHSRDSFRRAGFKRAAGSTFKPGLGAAPKNGSDRQGDHSMQISTPGVLQLRTGFS
jgi:hypothetical protein